MTERALEKIRTDAEAKMSQYTALVRGYANTLDLSSPSVLEQFEVAVRNTMEYDVFLELECIVLDIGSGVGLPGIPLAIRRPDLQITLCEIRKRRAAFLERAISLLSLKNTRVYNGNVKRMTGHRFDVVIAQAVGRLYEIYRLCEHLLKPEWVILTRKGADLDDELEELRQAYREIRISIRPLEDGTRLVAIYGGNE